MDNIDNQPPGFKKPDYDRLPGFGDGFFKNGNLPDSVYLKKIFYQIIAAFLFILIFVLIAYFLRKAYIDNQLRLEKEKNDSYYRSNLKLTPTSTVGDQNTLNPDLNLNFQQILTKYCLPEASSSPKINRQKTPVIIDKDLLDESVKEIDCYGEDKTRYLGFTDKNQQTFYIYDKSSKEVGHGRVGFFGLPGIEVEKKDPVIVNGYLSQSDGPLLNEEIALFLRGEKTIYLSKSEKVYVDVGLKAVAENFPELIGILNKYSVNDNQTGKQRLQNTAPAEIEAIKYFYGNLYSLKKEQEEALNKIKNLLSKISGDPLRQDKEYITPTGPTPVPGAPSETEIKKMFPDSVTADGYLAEELSLSSNNRILLLKATLDDHGVSTVPYFLIYDLTNKKIIYKPDSSLYFNSRLKNLTVIDNKEIKISMLYGFYDYCQECGYNLTEFIGYEPTINQFVTKNKNHVDEIKKILVDLQKNSACSVESGGQKLLFDEIKQKYGEDQACQSSNKSAYISQGITPKTYFQIKNTVEEIIKGKDLSLLF